MTNKIFSKKNIASFFYLICVVGLLSVFPYQANANSHQYNWKSSKNGDGIEVFLRNTKNSAVKSFKGVMTVDARLSSIVTVLEDMNSYPRWLHNCSSAKTVKKSSDTSVINYYETKMPWPVKDRDSVLLVSRTQDKSNKNIEFKMQSKPMFVSKVSGKVRIESMHGRWLLRPVGQGKVNVIYEMQIDPGGNVPKWIVNSMSVDLPFNSLSKMRQLIKEEKYAKSIVKGIID